MGRRGRRNKNREPIIIRLDHFHPKGAVGADEKGQTWRVWRAPVGATVKAWPGRKHTARRIEIVEPSPDAVEPECPLFGLCGGCQYQEMPLSAQRREKQAMVERLVGCGSEPVRGHTDGYGYRNKIELSFGVRRYLPEEEKDGNPLGHWLGFHPPGWFSKIVPVHRCDLATDGINDVIAAIHAEAPAPAWNNADHTGHWRHVVLRQGETLSVNLVTHPAVDPEQVQRVAERVLEVDGVGGVIWTTTDRVSDVAIGDTVRTWGSPEVTVQMNGIRLALPHDAFFQVNTEGAKILFETIGEALGDPEGATLLDLYCGVGAIGMIVGQGYSSIVGVELNEAAIRVARENAEANAIEGVWHAAKVEDVIETLSVDGPRHVVVDPPRAGLHPKAAGFLAQMDASVLVYVACSPSSLARDREILEGGGWVLERLWTIDLFPQTPHVEAVARFTRP